jgi:Protein of unknown function, DUF481
MSLRKIVGSVTSGCAPALLAVLGTLAQPAPCHAQATPKATPEATAPGKDLESILKIADYIKTRNGSVLLGRLKGGERGWVSFEIVDVEEDEVKLIDIAELRAGSSEFQVDIEHVGRVVGKIAAADKPGYFTIDKAGETITAPLTDIILLKRIELKFMERLDGYLGAGYSYTNASGIGRLNLTEAVIYGTEKFRVFQYGIAVYTLGDDWSAADQIDSGLGGMLGLKGRWLALQYFQYQKIHATGIESRVVSISGAGMRLVHNRWLDLGAVTGITLQKERAENGTEADLQSEIPLFLDFKLGIVRQRLELSGTSIFYTSLSVNDRYRFDNRLKLEYEPIKHLKIGLQGLFNRDTKPLDPTKDGTNWNLSVNFGYTF